VLVYKLYELTYDEVKIIDKDFWLSEGEYEKVKVGKK
jgi:beta-mannanase